jgi:nucleoid-associated protein YgaU
MFVRAAVLFALAAALVAIVARPSGGAGPEQVYVVKRADTLWSIAASHYGGDPRQGVWKLERRNHLRTELLRPGQRLVLP